MSAASLPKLRDSCRQRITGQGQPGPQRGRRRVSAAVVDDLISQGQAQRIELGAERAQQRIEVAGLVGGGHHAGDARRRRRAAIAVHDHLRDDPLTVIKLRPNAAVPISIQRSGVARSYAAQRSATMPAMYEAKTQPCSHAPPSRGAGPCIAAIALALVVLSLSVGMAGYMLTERMSALDAFVNAAMLLGGMGPVSPLKHAGGQALRRAVRAVRGPGVHRQRHADPHAGAAPAAPLPRHRQVA